MSGIRYLILALLLVPALSGCAAKKQPLPPPQQQASHDNLQAVHDIGMAVHMSGGAMAVRSIVPGSPAGEAGVQARDAILTVDGKKRTLREYFDLIMAKKAGDRVQLTIQRRNDVLKFDIATRDSAVPLTVTALRRLLSDERRVVLAVVTGLIANRLPESSESWEDIMRFRIQGAYEQALAGQFGEDRLFSLVDRMALAHTVLEYHVTETGTLPDQGRIRMRELSRATHILLVNVIREPAGRECLDRTDAVLIDAENGAVLAEDHKVEYACR